MSNSINIRRSYFGKNKYGEVIDNNFNQLTYSLTGSVSDFVTNFSLNFLDLTPVQLSLFYSGSVNIASSASDSDYIDEVKRLENLISGAREDIEIRKENTPVEHPVIPNDRFIRTTTPLINKDKIRLREGSFYFIREGEKRKIDNPETFINLFKSITKLNPYSRRENAFGDKDFVNLKSNVAVDTIGFLTNGQFPTGKTIYSSTLGEEGAQNSSSREETFNYNEYPPVGRKGEEGEEVIYNELYYIWNGNEWVLLYQPIGRPGGFLGEEIIYEEQRYIWDGFGEWNQSGTTVVTPTTTTEFPPFGVAGEYTGDTRTDENNKEYMWNGENWQLITQSTNTTGGGGGTDSDSTPIAT
jgi:hypothetical protein